MKINDVIIKEYQTGNIGKPGNVTKPGPASQQFPVQGGQPWPTSDAEIRSFQQANGLKVDGKIGTNTMTALQKAGATPPPGFKPVATKKQGQGTQNAPKTTTKVDAMAGSDASATNQSSGMTPQDRFAGQAKTDAQTGQNNLGVDEPRQADSYSTATGPAATGQDAPSAELDRLKQLAIGQPTLNQQASQQGAAMAQAAQPTTPKPDTNPLGVTAQAGNVFGQPGAAGDKPNTQTGQATQPMKTAQDFAPQPEISADTGLSTKAPQIGTGKDGKGPGLTDRFGNPVTTGSDDEMAWRSKQTGIVDVSKYPGPGNWDPKTGRTVQKDKQGNVIQQKSFGDTMSDFGTSISNFFTGKKAPSGQGTQPAGDQSGGSTTGNKAFLPGAAGGAKEDIERLRKLSGL